MSFATARPCLVITMPSGPTRSSSARQAINVVCLTFGPFTMWRLWRIRRRLEN
jgi:hypothetical protein